MSKDDTKWHAPGSFTLALIFLGWFVLAYVVQWMALAKNWFVY